jgi:thiol-disulfide isomerase/thioredoxin
MHRRRRRRGLIGIIGIIIVVAGVIGSLSYILYSYYSTPHVSVGSKAPDVPLFLTNGTTIQLSKIYGRPVLLWFITTWCPSCQQGAIELYSTYYSKLASKGVIIITVESYNNLGYQGPSISDFQSIYAKGGGKNWLFATSTEQATGIYNPDSYLDLYFLIDKSGNVVQSGTNLPQALSQIISLDW